MGGYCEHTENYHIEKTYGFFELIDKKDLPITEPGEVGEIVGSTLNNFGMPLIRYRTGDFDKYLGNHCENCKRNLPIIKKIQGRREKNNIYKKDGTYITNTALILHRDLYEVIEGLQYIQNTQGYLRVLIIKGRNFQKSHESTFYDHFLNAMGHDSVVLIEYVEFLLFEQNGKFRLLHNNIPTLI